MRPPWRARAGRGLPHGLLCHEECLDAEGVPCVTPPCTDGPVEPDTFFEWAVACSTGAALSQGGSGGAPRRLATASTALMAAATETCTLGQPPTRAHCMRPCTSCMSPRMRSALPSALRRTNALRPSRRRARHLRRRPSQVQALAGRPLTRRMPLGVWPPVRSCLLTLLEARRPWPCSDRSLAVFSPNAAFHACSTKNCWV